MPELTVKLSVENSKKKKNQQEIAFMILTKDGIHIKPIDCKSHCQSLHQKIHISKKAKSTKAVYKLREDILKIYVCNRGHQSTIY